MYRDLTTFIPFSFISCLKSGLISSPVTPTQSIPYQTITFKEGHVRHLQIRIGPRGLRGSPPDHTATKLDEDGVTRQTRVEHMGLCVPGDNRDKMIYSLGRAHKHWTRWDLLVPTAH